MASHAKEDIVAALLRQRPPTLPDLSSLGGPKQLLPTSAASSSSAGVIAGFNAVPLIKKTPDIPFDATLPSPSTAGPFIVPQMMGMMQVC
jgi:hypothetical protein